MKMGDVVRFTRDGPASPYDSGIWYFEYGLILEVGKNDTVLILANDEIVEAHSGWCMLAEDEKYEFIDKLIERYTCEVGSKKT